LPLVTAPTYSTAVEIAAARRWQSHALRCARRIGSTVGLLHAETPDRNAGDRHIVSFPGVGQFSEVLMIMVLQLSQIAIDR
jgi:hypothetical protein